MLTIVEFVMHWPLVSVLILIVVCYVFPAFSNFIEAAFYLFVSCAALVWLTKMVAP